MNTDWTDLMNVVEQPHARAPTSTNFTDLSFLTPSPPPVAQNSTASADFLAGFAAAAAFGEGESNPAPSLQSYTLPPKPLEVSSFGSPILPQIDISTTDDPLPGSAGSLGAHQSDIIPPLAQSSIPSVSQRASSNRRQAEAQYVCPVPGCGSTFTRHFNLKGDVSCSRSFPDLCC